MIVTRTPIRVSFVGGGSDLPAFYRRHGGAVVSMAIKHHVYVVVKRLGPFHTHRIRLSYSRTELVRSADEVQHPVVREALQMLGIEEPIEIVCIADVPVGTGLGSSSAFAVGLLHALHVFQGRRPSWQQLAEEACYLEIQRLAEPIGKQDQYAAAAGGFCHTRFHADGAVTREPLEAGSFRVEALLAHLLAFQVGGERQASEILQGVSDDMDRQAPRLLVLRDQCGPLLEVLSRAEFSATAVGALLHEGWRLKRETHPRVSSKHIDRLYENALSVGALGGKLLGAGGAGFLLLLAPPDRHAALREAFQNHPQLNLQCDEEGSRILKLEG